LKEPDAIAADDNAVDDIAAVAGDDVARAKAAADRGLAGKAQLAWGGGDQHAVIQVSQAPAAGGYAGAAGAHADEIALHAVELGGGASDADAVAQAAGDDVACGGGRAADDVAGGVFDPDPLEIPPGAVARTVDAEEIPFDPVVPAKLDLDGDAQLEARGAVQESVDDQPADGAAAGGDV
jgi:hypothetical protein